MAFDLKIVDAQFVACGLYDYSSAGLPDAENATAGMMAVSGGYMHLLDDGSWKQLALDTEHDTHNTNLATAVGISVDDTHLGNFATTYYVSNSETAKQALEGLDAGLNSVSGAFATSISNLQAAVGIGAGAEDLGTFTGAIIADESSVKVALQALETEAENFRGDLQTAVGIADEAQHLGTFTGAIIADNGTVKAALQALETEAENFRGDLQTAIGVSDEAQHLGTFTGGIIADNGTVKAGMQALETDADSVQSVLGIAAETDAFAWSGLNYLTAMAHGTVSGSIVGLDSNLYSISGAFNTSVTNLQSAVGVGAGAEDLGSFSGAIIADESSVKVALQALETEAENFRGDLQTAIGIADEAQHLGTFTGGVIADNGTVKAGMQSLETELENVRGDLQSAVGISDEAQHLGTFSGGIVSDNGTVKEGMQELETEVENVRGDIQSVLGVADEATGISWSGLNYLTAMAHSNVSASIVQLDSTVYSVSGAFNTSVTNLQSAVGVGAGAEDLGSFSGGIIADESSVKVALQALETEAENFRGDLQTAIGIADEAQHLGTFTGAIISDNVTVKAALQALETESENFRGDLQTAVGIADEAQHLGTFTGAIVSDNGTVKAGMQELETDVDSLQSLAGVAAESDAFAWSGLNYLTAMAHGTISGSIVGLDSNLYSVSGAFNTSVTNLQSAVGVGAGAEDLGSFSGGIIADESSVKVALQALETEAENFRGDLQTAIGISDEAQHLGTFTGAIISDNVTVKAALQALETESENFRGDLQTAVGIADEAQHLGTFTGGIIADNGTVKAGMQALETDADSVQSVLGVAAETEAFAWSGLNYLTAMAHGTVSGSLVGLDSNLYSVSGAFNTSVTNLQSAVGVGAGAEDLGSFSGAIIADESSVKVALQALETEAENFRGDLQTAIGISDEAQHLGTFTGGVIADNGTVKAGMQSLETELENVRGDLQTAVGISDEAQHLGTFTGAIIADNGTVKAALQALETEAENFRGDLQTAVGISDEAQHLGTFSGALISDNGTVKAGMQELETAVEAVVTNVNGNNAKFVSGGGAGQFGSASDNDDGTFSYTLAAANFPAKYRPANGSILQVWTAGAGGSYCYELVPMCINSSGDLTITLGVSGASFYVVAQSVADIAAE